MAAGGSVEATLYSDDFTTMQIPMHIVYECDDEYIEKKNHAIDASLNLIMMLSSICCALFSSVK
eukprot:13741674-Ditylum_brightwellii.AAC.2